MFKTMPNIYDGMFCKNSYLAHFLIFGEMKLSHLKKKRELALWNNFSRNCFFHPKKIFYTLGNANLEKTSNFLAKERFSYILVNGNPPKNFFPFKVRKAPQKLIIFGEIKNQKFSKLKVFILMIKRFFSFYNIVSYTQKAVTFHIRDIFVTFTTILSLWHFDIFHKLFFL